MRELEDRSYRILIVDDERVNITILNDILKDEYKIKVATGGAQALHRAVSEPKPDLILLDVVMPELDGFEVCRRLKAEPETADTPVIFITARNSEVDELKGLELGGVDFISKPIDPEIVRVRVRNHITLLRQKRQLEWLHNTDGLTGLANRRHFDEFLVQQWRHCLDARDSLGLLMMDIDHFKAYNDYYGHARGDDCLKEVAHALHQHMKNFTGLVARYGGEEFVCVLPGSDVGEVRAVADLLLQAVRGLAIPHEASPVAKVVTLSMGGSAMMPGSETTPEALLQWADVLLYRSKKAGRDQAVTQSPEMVLDALEEV